MKKLLLVFCVLMFVAHVDARVQLTPDEKMARRTESMKRTGGPIKLPAKGFVALLDFQNRVDFEKTSQRLKDMFSGFGLATKAFKSDVPYSFKFFETKPAELGAGAVVFVVDDPLLPMSLVSIESRCGLVNISALASDNPSQALLTRRAGKMVCRVATLASGGAESDAPTSMMKTVTSLKELDMNEGVGDEVYVMMGVIRGMAKAGVVGERRMSYKQACMLGEAPQPTNEFQKAIWDQVHSIPKNPMKIQFDSKKGR